MFVPGSNCVQIPHDAVHRITLNSRLISFACEPAKAWPSLAPRVNCEAKNPSSLRNNKGSCAGCMILAITLSAIWRNYFQSHGRPYIGRFLVLLKRPDDRARSVDRIFCGKKKRPRAQTGIVSLETLAHPRCPAAARSGRSRTLGGSHLNDCCPSVGAVPQLLVTVRFLVI